jgi:hypothetical protein
VARFDIYDAKGKLIRASTSAATAAGYLGVIPEEVEWAIEECGMCDNEEFVVVSAGDPFPE